MTERTGKPIFGKRNLSRISNARSRAQQVAFSLLCCQDASLSDVNRLAHLFLVRDQLREAARRIDRVFADLDAEAERAKRK